MNYSIFDIESDGLLHEDKDKSVATKIYCMSVHRVFNGKQDNFTLTTHKEMKKFLQMESMLIGHNIKRFDIPMLEKFLQTDLRDVIQVDTLALSWYLYPERKEHGLESWGNDLGIKKPEVHDWKDGDLELYIYRCEEDVKINTTLFNLQLEYLKQLYDGSVPDILRLIKYLSFKMECAKEQEHQKWKLDEERCLINLAKLKAEMEEKRQRLIQIMPKVTKYKVVSKPKNTHKKDGTLSAHGEKWANLLKEHDLPEYHQGAIKIPAKIEDGNPGSHQQLKDWLFSLGWEPAHVKIDKDGATGEIKRIPQLANQDGNDICDSVKNLYEKEPELEYLEGLFVLRHRIGILEGFLANKDSQGYLKAQVKGLTNTLRFQHTTLVNLPTIPKPYWEEVRGCLISDDGYRLCGSDMSSLEDNTKQHYMMYFDPEYVRIMRTPGFDPHLYMAVTSKALSYDEMEFYKWYDKKRDGKTYEYYPPPSNVNPTANSILGGFNFKDLCFLEEKHTEWAKIIKPIRLKSKKVNFAAVYGAGPPKLALTASIPVNEAKELHTAYWIINRSVKQIAQGCRVKTIGKQMWLFNPVSRFWYSLREEKDRFSTLNQGTGVYCFDTWVRHVRTHGIKLVGQFHDEIIFRTPLGKEDEYRGYLLKSIDLTNAELKLNVPLKISVDFGHSYAEIH